MRRWIHFLIMIVIGLGIGLSYGWLINPTRDTDTNPDSLRIDYKTDYVLMTAEAYQSEQDLELVVRRLALLGDLPPREWIEQSIVFAKKAGYNESDIARMQTLSIALESFPIGQGTVVP